MKHRPPPLIAVCQRTEWQKDIGEIQRELDYDEPTVRMLNLILLKFS